MNHRLMATCPLTCPSQADLDALLRQGVSPMALAQPVAVMTATGHHAADGLFEDDLNRDRWVAFEELDAGDIVFWNRRSGKLCSWAGRVFALGESVIDQPATYSFDCNLNIFADPLEWLRAKRDGIVVLPDKWQFAFERLWDAPRIAIAEQLLPLYRRHMKPGRMPELMVLPERRRAA